MGFVVGAASPVMAANGVPQPGGGGARQDPAEIDSSVQYNQSRPGSGGTPMAPVGQSWSPPACWFEPRYSPKEFEQYANDAYVGPQNGGGQIPNDYAEDDFHRGDKGSWYELVVDEAAPESSYRSQCGDYYNQFMFIGPADPAPAGTPVIDPEILAGLAYARTRLPAPPVELSPGAGRQLVNFDTQVKFAKQLERVWVTASINNADVDLAATTVATPATLHVEAGTANASPAACDYKLVDKGDGYAVDTAGSDCNITYRRASGDTNYTFQASITWNVKWTDSADPDGPAQEPEFPDGQSTTEIPVTVKEVQTVTR
ncbi:hypothetical protein [Streptomyces boninensis]|uniref:hypothetical protein n=1 Tax=Streptomyces boninensis TaxID=2039455 RepID=UPI003B228903